LEANIVNKVGERRVRGVARLKLAVLDPQVAREFGIIAAHLFDEALSVVAADEHFERIAEREVG
jgi:hypothetical protein